MPDRRAREPGGVRRGQRRPRRRTTASSGCCSCRDRADQRARAGAERVRVRRRHRRGDQHPQARRLDGRVRQPADAAARRRPALRRAGLRAGRRRRRSRCCARCWCPSATRWPSRTPSSRRSTRSSERTATDPRERDRRQAGRPPTSRRRGDADGRQALADAAGRQTPARRRSDRRLRGVRRGPGGSAGRDRSAPPRPTQKASVGQRRRQRRHSEHSGRRRRPGQLTRGATPRRGRVATQRRGVEQLGSSLGS